MKPLKRIKPALIGWRDDLGDQPPAGLVGTINPALVGAISPDLVGTIGPGLWGNCSGLVGAISPGLWGNCSGLVGCVDGLTGNIADHVQEDE